MKNIFDFATKELSQDAFLMWLFENHECENESVRQCAYGLLNEFSGLNMRVGDIENLRTYSQYPCKPISGKKKRGKMDVLIRFVYQGEVYLTVIEDKTFSSQHDNQLLRYNGTLYAEDTMKRFDVTAEHIHKVFYKTDIEDALDKKACQKAGWKVYFLEDIYTLLHRFIPDGHDTGSDILNDYIAYISSQRTKTIQLPDTPMKEWQRISLRTFFYQKVMGELTDPRINGKNLLDVKYYHYLEFQLQYYIPHTIHRISIGFVMRKQSEGVGIHLYMSDFPKTENPLDNRGEARCEQKVEQAVIKTFVENSDWFTKSSSKGRETYFTFGKLNRKRQKAFLYENGPEQLAAAIRELLVFFMDVCEKISL